MDKENIDQQINMVLEELGFEKIMLHHNQVYKWRDNYYKLVFVDEFQAYIIEFALTLQEAEKNIFEDSDMYPLSLENLIADLRVDLLNYYNKKEAGTNND